MASNIVQSSLRNAFTRSYSTQASPFIKRKTYAIPEGQPTATKLPNGAVVVAHDNNSPISKVAIYVRSGSRYESYDNKGVSHVLRLCAGQKTKNYSAFGITRTTQQMGGNIVCESGREFISYEITSIRESAEDALSIISDIATNSLFRPWEVKDQNSRFLTELALLSPSATVLDLLHAAAFRNTGLGNSLFIPDNRIGKVTSEQLKEFVNQTHVPHRMAIVGLGGGVPYERLVKFGQLLKTDTEFNFNDAPSPYAGGEVRSEIGGPLAYVALVGPGAKIGSEEAASFAIAQYILGGSSSIQYGSSASRKMGSLLTSAGGTGNVTAINANYSDAGLFGFLLVEQADKAGDVVKAIAKGVRTLKITDVDVKNAKARAKAALFCGTESMDGQLEDMGLQALFTGNYLTPAQVAESIDKVTASSVQSVISNSAKGKLSMASVGNLRTVPYIDQL